VEASRTAGTSADHRARYALVLAIIVALATALRLAELGYWPLEGAEIFTLRDSLVTNNLRGSRPLLFFLNYHLIRPWFGLGETALRVIPAISGILAVPVLYYLVARIATPRAGLFAAFLVAVNAQLVTRSQHGRYWTLVFLLTAAYTLAFYIGIRERKRAWIIGSLLLGLLAVLAHPTAGLLAAGIGLWLLIVYGAKADYRRLRASQPARWVLAAGTLAAALTTVWLIPLLQNWLETSHLKRLSGTALVLSQVDGLTAELSLVAIAGVLWTWHRDRSLAVFLAALVVVPTVFLVALSYGTAVSTAYLFPTAPMIFVAAALFLDRLTRLQVEPWTKWLLTGTVMAVLLASNVPGLWSQYRDGGRPDLRAAAAYLKGQLGPDDGIVSDQSRTLKHYLPDARITPLRRRPEKVQASMDTVRQAGNGKLWIVVQASLRAGFKNHKLGLGPIADWVYGNCQLRHTVEQPRLDFRNNGLQIFECPVGGAGPRAGSAPVSRTGGVNAHDPPRDLFRRGLELPGMLALNPHQGDSSLPREAVQKLLHPGEGGDAPSQRPGGLTRGQVALETAVAPGTLVQPPL
jgi:dolichyl-phosphate-mannose-protein mannosyltransferase